MTEADERNETMPWERRRREDALATAQVCSAKVGQRCGEIAKRLGWTMGRTQQAVQLAMQMHWIKVSYTPLAGKPTEDLSKLVSLFWKANEFGIAQAGQARRDY